MTTAPTPEEVRALAERLEHCVAKWGKQNALSLEAYSAVKMMRRLLTESERLRAERDEADRRAGAAERSAAAFHETSQRFEQVRRRMKEQWGVRDNVSFDLVWQQALDAKQALAELEARKPLPLSAEGPAMDWRPIETAPKDGTWIMLWRAPAKAGDGWTADPLVIARWYEDEFGDAEWTWPDDPFDPFTPHGIARANEAVESGASWGEENFTHWIPLPPPPEAS